MSVDIFDRMQFEKVLGTFPLGYHFRGAESGQLEYIVPIASKVRCAKCGISFFVAPSKNRKNSCPNCKHLDSFPSTVVPAGEMNLLIYSSIDPRTGWSREAGKDSIRLVLGGDGGFSKVGCWVTRLPGWEERLLEKARELWGAALAAPRCKKGHKGLMYKVGSGVNEGRKFWRCTRCHQFLGWVEGE